MAGDRHLRRKLTLRAHGEQVVFVKSPAERIEHVWMKAFLWALYLPDYPALSVETRVGDRYKPDVVSLDRRSGRPIFWGEAGKVGPRKLESLFRRHRYTHFAFARWAGPLAPFEQMVRDARAKTSHRGAVDLIAVPADAPARLVEGDGSIHIEPGVLEIRSLWPGVGSRP